MDNIKGVITGTVITVLIGGTAYTFSQEDVVQNFADETGMTQEQAEQYINDIPEEDLATFTEIGSALVEDSQLLLSMASDINCLLFEYEWQSLTLSCLEGKTQLAKLANNSKSLGDAFILLDTESASEEDVTGTIELIDQVTADLRSEMSNNLWDASLLEEEIQTHAYNKAILKAILESEA